MVVEENTTGKKYSTIISKEERKYNTRSERNCRHNSLKSGKMSRLTTL
jgi:hypothetical protein